MKKKYFIIMVFVFISFFLILLLSKVVNNDNITIIPEEKPCPEKAYFNLQNHLHNIDKSKFKQTFPYDIYIDSANYCDINSILYDLKLMNLINPDAKANRRILAKALTEKLEEKNKNLFNNYNPDGLIMILQWVNKLNHYKDIDTANIKLYRIIHRYWYNYVSNKLSQYNDDNSNLKYGFKFKYLLSTCQSNNYPPDIRFSNTAKVIDNVINNKWAYLFKRFWDGTNFVFKFLLSIISVLTLYGYYCIFIVNFKKK